MHELAFFVHNNHKSIPTESYYFGKMNPFIMNYLTSIITKKVSNRLLLIVIL